MLDRIPTSLPENVSPQGGGKRHARITEWLWNSLYCIYILLSFLIGMSLMYFPWISLWESNYLLYRYPQFHPLVANAFFRGFVVGLGITNIAIGIHELVQFIHSWESRHLSG